MRLFKSQEEKREITVAEGEFNDFVAALAQSDPDQARQLAEGFTKNSAVSALQGRQRQKLSDAAFDQYAATILADDHLTEDEEDAFAAVAEALGFTQADLVQHHDVYLRLQVAKLNDGRLPVVDSPKLMAKKGEIVYFETGAGLTKEVTLREFRGGSQGVSFRVAKGVRYRVGSMRGHMVTVGTQVQIVDTGILSITNKRVAYLGSRKTIDMPYPKLLGIEMFTDGVTFSLSNRQTAPLFKVTCNADLLGAMLNAAAQDTTTDRPPPRTYRARRGLEAGRRFYYRPTRSPHLPRGKLGLAATLRGSGIESHSLNRLLPCSEEPILDLAVVVRVAPIAFSIVFARACPARHALQVPKRLTAVRLCSNSRDHSWAASASGNGSKPPASWWNRWALSRKS